ncbi:MAG: GGDEF domain-containing protein [Burkholderiales bacterium]|nr:GGDEF domain-containing protein [Burkholderiales bacterium]MDE2159643.1 GGDEF domain-containing protein [Burkholderiales bacterium]
MATETAAPTPAALAKGALRRLAQAKLEPTPENYARAYADEAGLPAPEARADAAGEALAALKAELKAQGAAWAALAERLAKNLDRGGRQWTQARRKDSIKRVFDNSRSDPVRLLQRAQALMGAWESDQVADAAEVGAEMPALEVAMTVSMPAGLPAAGAAALAPDWPPLVEQLEGTLRAGLLPDAPRGAELAAELAQQAEAIARDGVTPDAVAAVAALCERARRLFAHRHHLVEGLSELCRELAAGLGELSEDDSWVRGQALIVQSHLGFGAADAATDEDELGVSMRGVRAAGAVLAETRQQQQRLRGERQAARTALKQMIQTMLVEVDELGEHTGRFQRATARHAEAIERADSVAGLAGVVQAMLDDVRTVQTAVGQTQERLQADRDRAGELEGRVLELESELRRLSEEVSTDALTQVANRRGLMQSFETEAARCARHAAAGEPALLAVALIDIDNFKKLNDSLGHAAGDQALKNLAAAVRERLRPADHLARFGGEEFVVLLPGSEVAEAQQALTRLQRSLSEALFLHEGREVFVTFSAGVTAWRAAEPLQAALERADEALYEAKRTGKNRTCIG